MQNFGGPTSACIPAQGCPVDLQPPGEGFMEMLCDAVVLKACGCVPGPPAAIGDCDPEPVLLKRTGLRTGPGGAGDRAIAASWLPPVFAWPPGVSSEGGCLPCPMHDLPVENKMRNCGNRKLTSQLEADVTVRPLLMAVTPRSLTAAAMAVLGAVPSHHATRWLWRLRIEQNSWPWLLKLPLKWWLVARGADRRLIFLASTVSPLVAFAFLSEEPIMLEVLGGLEGAEDCTSKHAGGGGVGQTAGVCATGCSGGIGCSVGALESGN
eukprot:CAMPEP_0172912482 /NCGR_PEP_ID=MMETSP1075-20121228/188477_1 /TAXON_ID=2916 /ORGANISM="Ceratium fusus, Strain PA161109" /LENGTH=265 /DNA_ID=CAMNT_0013770989 /DNA_START=103 /DNA_END=903 /DNA_ORIENTATION=+